MMKFLEGIAQNLLAKHGSNLSNVLVLMPNQRSCTYLRNELKKRAKQVVFAPEISTLNDWMLGQSKLVPADSIELITELYNCHKQIGGNLSLDEFLGTASVLISDFEEIDVQMADARLFFFNLEQLQSMKIYEPGGTPTEYKLQYRKFWEDFGKLYYLLREKLLAAGKGYTGMILREVAENKGDLNTDYAAIYIAGFSTLNKTDEVIISHLLVAASTNVIWDADNYYVRDEMNEAGAPFRKYKTKFKVGEDTFLNHISTAEKRIQIIGAAKNVGQVKVVADILQNQLALNENTALDTVIIVPDEKLLSPLIANLPANVTSLNITMGLTIAGSNPASFFEILFRLQNGSHKYQSKNRGQRFYYKDVFDLLQHSYFRLVFGGADTDGFVQLMKKQNRVLIRREELDKVFGSVINPLLFEGEDAALYAGYLWQISNALVTKLVEQARSGNSALAADTEIAFRLHSIITNTRNVFAGGNSTSIKTYIALLKENFRNERVALEGDPVQGLQIMGLYETRSLDFKNVIILSANEGILSSGKNERSYIPYEMRSEFLSTYKDRDAISAYLFYRLLHRVENLFVLYNTEPDELGGGEKSRFILQLEQELRVRNPSAKIQDMIFAVDPPPAIAETPIDIYKNDEIMAKLDAILLNSGLSPSALNTYINCSLQYYFRYIAGLKEQEDMEESMEAATIGSAVHYALEKIYEEKVGQVVTVDFIEAQYKNKQRIESLVRHHLIERFDNESLSSGKNLLLFKVCVKLTEEYLKHEKKNIEQLNDAGADLSIELLEGKLEYEIPINGKRIKVAGRVDRIERAGGVIQIADYKTSKYSRIPILDEETWEILTSDPKHAKPVQLLVYAWLYNRSKDATVPVRSGIYWLRESDKTLDTIRLDKTNDIMSGETINRFEEKLKAVLTEMQDTTVPFAKTPHEERCIYCEFRNICER